MTGSEPVFVIQCMYNQNFKSRRPQGRSGGGFSRGAGSAFGGNRGRSRFSRGGGSAFAGNRNRSRGPKGDYIDPSRFINKAVAIENEKPYEAQHSFNDFAVNEQLKRAIIAKGYKQPTPIQDQAIPVVLAGNDIVGIANTGTGKTAAFLIPLIHKVMTNQRERALIVAPTRELAIQIEEELRGFTKGLRIFSACCVGGAPIGRQMAQLRYNNQFIIGTPGRLKDLIERKRIDLNGFATIVLDEADRMLDMGFVHDMRYLMERMPAKRHTLFFSATLSREIEKLIAEFLNEPTHISVKTRDTAQNVEQDVVRVRGQVKFDVLHDLLNQDGLSKVLIFGRTKHGVEKLSQSLTEKGLRADAIHGNKSHGQRQQALKRFKENKVTILVATDVAARGLDINGVTHVINYDLPSTYDDYVHRIGRTGRGEQRGKALTFID